MYSQGRTLQKRLMFPSAGAYSERDYGESVFNPRAINFLLFRDLLGGPLRISARSALKSCFSAEIAEIRRGATEKNRWLSALLPCVLCG